MVKCVKIEVLGLFLLSLVILTVALPVTKTEKKADGKEAEKAKEEHPIKYDEGYGEEDPRNRPDVSEFERVSPKQLF